MENEFTRTEMLFGSSAIETLKHSHVAVFGVGGVGSYVVEVLARSGVGELTLVDNDEVSISNLNRQLVALHSTLGKKKVEVARQRILDINPSCKVHTHSLFYLPETAEQVDLTNCDYVVDCIDTMAAKIELVKQCHQLQLPIIASMGAANKIDPTQFKVADISKTAMDPLAKVLRKKLRKMGITHLKVVYSEEPPRKPFEIESTTALTSPLEETVKAPTTNQKRTTPASNAFVPATAGLILEGAVVKDLIRMKSATSD